MNNRQNVSYTNNLKKNRCKKFYFKTSIALMDKNSKMCTMYIFHLQKENKGIRRETL